MLNFTHSAPHLFCDGVSRRGFLQAGALALGGLTLAQFLQLQAQGAVSQAAAGRSVIMICLGGGPSQLDMYDMKPRASSEVRGEFNAIRTNNAALEICELMPRQARLADRFSVVRNMQWIEPDHQRAEIFSGFPRSAHRPSFGSLVSRLYPRPNRTLPGFVSLSSEYDQELKLFEQPQYVGAAHRAFIPTRSALDDFGLPRDIPAARLENRKALLGTLDNIRKELDASGEFAGRDAFTAQALEMITSSQVREAFDISQEPQAVLDRYGREGATYEYNLLPNPWDYKAFVRARRLVEAGVPYISMQVGLWDHHGGEAQGSIFRGYRTMLPQFDQSFSALLEDLRERGLEQRTAVIVWGEFGRTPQVNKGGGRDHWPQAGFALFAGGLKQGRVIGATDSTASQPTVKPYGPQNALATLYKFLGIDPAATLPDFNGRPVALLEDREVIAELF